MGAIKALKQHGSQHHTRRLAISSAIIAGLSTAMLMGGCDVTGSKIYRTRAMQVSHIAGMPVSIESSNGSIEAIQVDRADVQIDVKLYGRDQARLDQVVVQAVRVDDGTLRVWIDWPGDKRHNGEGASIEMQLPDASGIEARTSNGSITIAGLSGHAKLESSNGRITVERHDGSVYADTSNGSLKAQQVSGEIEMYSSNGRVNVDDAFGPVRVETSNGSIQISTMDGNEGPVRVRTSNGRVELELGDGFVGVLRCQTSNGKIKAAGLENASLVESSKGSAEFHFQGSNEVSAIRTSNGSVHIRGRHAQPSDD